MYVITENTCKNSSLGANFIQTIIWSAKQRPDQNFQVNGLIPDRSLALSVVCVKYSLRVIL